MSPHFINVADEENPGRTVSINTAHIVRAVPCGRVQTAFYMVGGARIVGRTKDELQGPAFVPAAPGFKALSLFASDQERIVYVTERPVVGWAVTPGAEHDARPITMSGPEAQEGIAVIGPDGAMVAPADGSVFASVEEWIAYCLQPHQRGYAIDRLPSPKPVRRRYRPVKGVKASAAIDAVAEEPAEIPAPPAKAAVEAKQERRAGP